MPHLKTKHGLRRNLVGFIGAYQQVRMAGLASGGTACRVDREAERQLVHPILKTIQGATPRGGPVHLMETVAVIVVTTGRQIIKVAQLIGNIIMTM